MSGPTLTLRLDPGRAYRIAGKALIVVLAGTLLGLAMASQARRDGARAASLTEEQYAAEYGAYKEQLAKQSGLSPAVYGLAGMLLLSGAVGAYELLGYAAGWAMLRLFGRGRSAPPPRENST